MNNKQILISEIQSIGERKKALRARERSVQELERSNNGTLYSQPAVKTNKLKNHLEGLLPSELVPSNVGSLSQVTWGFFYQIDFELGQDIVFDHNFKAEKTFKINSDAAFLISRIYRHTRDQDQAGFAAPLCLSIKDLQSSRQLNDNPIPVQAIPTKGYYWELPVPFLLYPSASMSIELTSWLPVGAEIETTGNNYQGFSLYGSRVRIKDQNHVVRTMLSK